MGEETVGASFISVVAMQRFVAINRDNFAFTRPFPISRNGRELTINRRGSTIFRRSILYFQILANILVSWLRRDKIRKQAHDHYAQQERWKAAGLITEDGFDVLDQDAVAENAEKERK